MKRMPLVIDRKTGTVLEDTAFTQEQSDRAWAIILEAFLRRNPERVADLCIAAPEPEGR